MTAHVAYLFPTFPMRHREFRHEQLPGYAELVHRLAERAAALVTIDAHTFDPPAAGAPPQTLEATLQAHYACYIESLAMAAWLEPRFPPADYVAAYSMGLFAAVCHTGALSFEDGLRVMQAVCVTAHEAVAPGSYAMGVVIGMTAETIRALLPSDPAAVEVTDTYGPHIVILSGPRVAVAGILGAFTRQGAVETRLIPMTAPFHSSALARTEPLALEMLRDIQVNRPHCGLVSALTQEVLTRPEELRSEIARNVSHPMCWYGTMRVLLQLDVTLLLECGPSQSLTNLAREDLPGPYAIHDYRDFERLFAPAN